MVELDKDIIEVIELSDELAEEIDVIGAKFVALIEFYTR